MTSLRESLGPYRLLEEIGVGGMGEVHLALAPDGRTVAVKILHPAVARDALARRRLEREVATMRRVHSPYVAEVVDADFTGRRPYVVTRYVEGRSLDVRVRGGGPLRGSALPRVARGLVRALHVIHAAGVVHRDLKPANVMLLDRDPVVIDFGLAHVLDATRLTRTGTAIGTPGYLAPEILDGDRAGPAADVFSWAGTVAFAATGRSPYGPGPAQAIFSRVLRGRHDLRGVPGELRAMLEAALALDPESRPGTGDLLEALAVRGRPRPVAVPDGPPEAAGPEPDGPASDRAPDGRAAQGGAPGEHAVQGRVPGERASLDGREARSPAPGDRAAPRRAPDGPVPEAADVPVAAGAAEGERRAEPGAGTRRRGLPARLVRGTGVLVVPAACYALPVVAVATILSACAAGYTWDAIARARRRTEVRVGRLARLRSVLGALVAVPAQTVARLVALVSALVVGYGAVLAITWWSVVPRERALALPLGVLAVVAAVVRARYASERRPVRLVVAVLAAGMLVPAVLGIPFPAWWPVTAP
ncbi:protein kinase [Actinoallomurus purpureus]|uniref:serine/threonine protein kinase n=1 Tax=Actinoallomurus purpureus TaxID=478114 RepID=UPI002093FDC4|nr:serine/threonine protein kinase [Actinoallomurus purpureus]MCO6007521.1 protein kinase [Actinoallomurus purpureus]